jgi:hypothetical protein
MQDRYIRKEAYYLSLKKINNNVTCFIGFKCENSNALSQVVTLYTSASCIPSEFIRDKFVQYIMMLRINTTPARFHNNNGRKMKGSYTFKQSVGNPCI